ncbi:MAG: right-handed parallel beta-helix repeat-containing protein [candidate division KSB1 bacterium]|nr:right-handed parallel beta-helix repeat-containing protein [candidate division KSB1 bacterium]MDZ7303136.1 right-handed parallel beta-helix repeat-containing protein [candidate division KSB1 bacterium]MDZ7310117.1 right-handed parallel beta-helix repeat-containing protein [candidate division KSB1 bacterium]
MMRVDFKFIGTTLFFLLTIINSTSAQVSQDQARAELDTLMNAPHGFTDYFSGETIARFLEKVKTNPDPYLAVIRQDLVLPAEKESLADSNFENSYSSMTAILGQIGNQEARDLLKQAYFETADRLKSLTSELSAALENSAPRTEIVLIAKAVGSVMSLQVDIIGNLADLKDNSILSDCLDRIETEDRSIQAEMLDYFDTVGIGNASVISRLEAMFLDRNSSLHKDPVLKNILIRIRSQLFVPPSITSLSPDAAMAGDEAFTLTLTGTNFISVSTVHWNGLPRATTFISSTQLQAVIAKSDITAPGTVDVTVVNPVGSYVITDSAGAMSNSMPFTIVEAPPENILSVPSQYATIQAAVTASQPGDIIEVSPGFYNEVVNITGKDSIIVRTTGSIDGVTCKGFLLKQSHQVTIKGFVVDASGTGEHGIVLMGGNNQNSDITLEANAIKNAGNDFSGISVARGNTRTRIVNNRIHSNGRNGIRFIDATGGPHYLINNTIVQNGWNGVEVARQHVIYLVNNILSFNGTKSGSTGGRYGVLREAMTGAGEAAGITLLNNLIVGNHGHVTSSSSSDLGNYVQTLDGTDSGNLTTSGAEGSGVSASPTAAFVDILISQTPLDLHLKASSVAIDRGVNSYSPPDAVTGSIPSVDFEEDRRPKGAAVDLGADETP